MSSRIPPAGDAARAVARWMPHPLRRRLAIGLHRSALGRRLGRDAPFVSVIVAASDLQGPYLSECLDSIRAQTRGAFEVIVMPYAGATAVAEVGARYGTQDWRFAVGQRHETYGAALNAGARRAAGDFVTFVGASDTLPPDAFERLVATLERTGSDVAVGNLTDAAPVKHFTRSEHARAHRRDRFAVTLADEPDALADVHIGNRMFRSTFWHGAKLSFPESDSAPASLPIERAYVAARSFDLLAAMTYHLTKRGDGAPFGYLKPAAPGLREWRTQQRTTLAELEAHDDAGVLDGWLYATLDNSLRPYLDDAERYDDQDWALLRDAAAELHQRADPEVWGRVRPEVRVATWLASRDMRAHVEEFVARRWFEPGEYPTQVRDGAVNAVLPYTDDESMAVPDDCLALTEREVRPVVSVQRLNWTDDRLVLDLFTYIRSVDTGDTPPEVTVSLVRDDKRLAMDADVLVDPVVTRHAGEAYQSHDHGLVRATAAADALVAAPIGAEWTLEVSIAVGAVSRTTPATELGWQGSAAALRPYRGQSATLEPRWIGDTGHVLAVEEPTDAPHDEERRFVIDAVTQCGTLIEVSGVWTGAVQDTVELALERADVRLESETTGDDERRTFRFDARTDPWSLGPRPAPTGPYHPRCSTGDGASSPVEFGRGLLDTLPTDDVGDVYRMRLRRSPHGTPVVELSPPLEPREQGPYGQHRLQRWYAGEHPIDDGAVYLQSYVGQTATDSPLAIHHALRERRPELTLYWGVIDHSQRVPEGAVPVLMRSTRWYEVLATAKYVVSNIDFERWFVHREGQHVLQTYHGFPSKTMGIGLWREKQFTQRRIAQQLARTSDLWDALITPTPEVNRYYRDAFRYHGTILDKGYPRDDVLVSGDAGPIRTATRERLGIRPEQTAVLYAPTWRDDVATGYRAAPLVSHFDIDAAVQELGDDYILLVRGHRFHGAQRELPGVIDVTGYPEINDLILASDAAVLDYSSLRFDYSLTRKPMIFLVPDLDDYTGGVRGFLYDFRGTAPGPLVADTPSVVAELRHLDDVTAAHVGEYDSFHAQYNRWQDGHAAERVVDAFF